MKKSIEEVVNLINDKYSSGCLRDDDEHNIKATIESCGWTYEEYLDSLPGFFGL
jgi:hypothetical protein